MSPAGPGEARASIVVATTRDAARLQRCLDAVERCTRDVPYELVLVLNGADEDVRAVAAARPGARVVSSAVNLGFAGAANLGRGAASSGAIVTLHDDVEVSDGWLSGLLAAAERHPAAGVIGARSVTPDGLVQYAGVVLLRDGTPLPVGNGTPADDPAFQVSRPVDFVSLCCAVVRAETWDAAGGMDEHYFPAGYGDVDLGFAARRAGWEVRVEGSVTVSHAAGGGTLSVGYKTWLHARNRARFLERWSGELADHDPPETPRAEAIERGLARAARRAERIDRDREASPPPFPDRTVDPAALPAREVSLMREYLAHADAARQALEAELTETHERAAQEIAARDDALAEKDAYIASLIRDDAAREGR